VSGALLGLEIATASIIAGFIDKPRVRAIQSSAAYPYLRKTVISPIRWLGLATVIGLVALAVLCVCGCGGLFVVTGGAIGTVFTQVAAPTAVGVEFMTAIQKDDYTKAYALCAPTLQSELGSPAGLSKLISNNNAQPASWSFSNTNLNNDRLELGGTATFTSGKSGTVSLVIDKVGNDWKVAGFKLTPQ